MTKRELAKLIDHTLLKPMASEKEIVKHCREAVDFGFKAVCVHGCWVPKAARLLEGHQVELAAVVAFPLGTSHHEVKAYEARRAVTMGASEIDMVINLGALKEGDDRTTIRELESVVGAVKLENSAVVVKVIIETGYLTHEEKVRACRLAVGAGAEFVKTSTGFGPGGATIADVKLMKDTVGPRVGVKASGGIRTRTEAIKMIQAGANRIGTSSGIAIVSEEERDS